jgi:hypothetical protein
MSRKDQIQSILYLLSFIFGIIPVGFQLLSYILSPNPPTEASADLLLAGFIPWWIRIVTASPLLFVGLILIAEWADAGEVI